MLIPNVFEHDPDAAFSGVPGFVLEPTSVSMRMHNVRLRENMMAEIKEAVEDGKDVSR
jgi:hypothetical protein